MAQSLSVSESLALIRDRRFIVVFLMGFSSGLPWALHGSVLTLWLQDSGLSRTAIGYIGAVTAIYALNWMWSPVVDRVHLPFFCTRFGQRRGWIMFTQCVMVLFLLLLSQTDPTISLLPIGLAALGIATTSATHDIAVDAYRIKLFSRAEMEKRMPIASALATAGWWAGYGFIGGALALLLGSDQIGLSWGGVYQVMAGVYVLLFVLVSRCPDPEKWEGEEIEVVEGALRKSWFTENVIGPFVEFFQRCGLKLGIVMLVFLFSFRLGEAMLGRMSLVFYVELGFSTEQLALYQKFVGGLAIVVFSLIGALINIRYGIIRGMLVGGIAMASSNLMYAVMAQVGPEPWLFILTLLIDNFTSAFATVAVMSFMSYFASRTYTGTQFALMTSISNFGRTTLAAGSGWLIDSLDGNWVLFFILTTVAVLPSLFLLIWVGKLVRRHEARMRPPSS